MAVGAVHNEDVRAPSPAKRNDLRLNLQSVVDMLLEREGHTGGAHARWVRSFFFTNS